MNSVEQSFIEYLQRLSKENRGAMAELRRSLTFAPGTTPRVYPYVEPFIDKDAYESRRQAFYLVAGLFALHPTMDDNASVNSLGKAMGTLYCQQDKSPSVEGRFIALLESDGETLAEPLRHCVTLLKSHDLALNYIDLLKNLSVWLNPDKSDILSEVRRRWATDFYRASINTETKV